MVQTLVDATYIMRMLTSPLLQRLGVPVDRDAQQSFIFCRSLSVAVCWFGCHFGVVNRQAVQPKSGRGYVGVLAVGMVQVEVEIHDIVVFPGILIGVQWDIACNSKH